MSVWEWAAITSIVPVAYLVWEAYRHRFAARYVAGLIATALVLVAFVYVFGFVRGVAGTGGVLLFGFVLFWLLAPTLRARRPPPALTLNAALRRELAVAQQHLRDGHYRSAVRAAGPVLEVALKRRFPLPRGVDERDMEMSYYFDRAVNEGVISPAMRRQVAQWWALRIRATHTLDDIGAAQAREMVEGVARLAEVLARRK